MEPNKTTLERAFELPVLVNSRKWKSFELN